jgi:predicted phosphodiesterase
MKIAFVTDLHIGASPADYHQQTYWEEGHDDVVDALYDFIEENKVDLLLLGGDMTHATLPDEIETFVDMFRDFHVGMIYCLGNHDVCVSPTTDHMALWRQALSADRYFALAPLAAITPAVDVLALNTRWRDAQQKPALWYQLGSGPVACLGDEDLKQLDAWLAKEKSKPAILMIHGELDGLPPELTGLDHETHVPDPAYTKALNEILDRHPRCRLVLSGHNHVTHAVWHGKRVHLTTGSMTEYPFYVRLIEVTAAAINVTTHPLLKRPPHIHIDQEKKWSLGRESDRNISIPPA